MMVWWVHHVVTTKQHLDQPKSFILRTLFTNSVLVSQNLSKFTTNTKLLKIFWSLHLQHLCVKYCPYEKKLWINNLSLPMHSHIYRYDDDRVDLMSLNPTISYFSTVNSPSIIQMTSNLAQGWTVTHVKWCFAQCHASLFVFSRKSCRNSSLGFHLWSIYACIYQNPF